MTFDEWAFIQCVQLGHKIESVKSEAGLNIAWINMTTKERFTI